MMLGVVKLGGAAITNKDRPFSLDVAKLEALGKALFEAMCRKCIDSLVVVHGGGSYGHTVVHEHGGLRSLDAFIQTIQVMREMNQKVVEILMLCGLKAVGLDTHAIAMFINRRLMLNLDIVSEALRRGLVPVLYGDAVFANGNEFAVASGDDLAWEIACKLRARRLVFVTSVPGVYVRGRIVDTLSLSRDLASIDRLSESAIDVTGGMATKLAKGLGRVSSIGSVYVIGFDPRILLEALCSRPSIGTRVIE